LGEVLDTCTEKRSLEKCVECDLVKDPELHLWFPPEIFYNVEYTDSYCPKHRREYYNSLGITSNKSEAIKP